VVFMKSADIKLYQRFKDRTTKKKEFLNEKKRSSLY